MPFTLAHPAIVVPLALQRLILSALIIGSMTPDLEYFIRLSDISHIMCWEYFFFVSRWDYSYLFYFTNC
jgi:hypothetical protein